MNYFGDAAGFDRSAGGSSSSRKGKKSHPDKPKQPQRGLGVAQLEKIRLHSQLEKYVKDPVEIHNIKQRDGETLEDFMERFKIETGPAEANKFQPPPPMVTPVEKRNGNKFCDFHNDKGHSTDECMQLKKQIEELVRAGKLSHLIKEIKQGREQPKTGRKEATAKDKPTTIYMVRSWQRTVKQKITQSFEQGK
nr:reverse transcriptase domain-containing protein [Tanacetum cinerariifolium]